MNCERHFRWMVGSIFVIGLTVSQFASLIDSLESLGA